MTNLISKVICICALTFQLLTAIQTYTAPYEEIDRAEYARELLMKRLDLELPESCRITQLTERTEFENCNDFMMQVYIPPEAYDAFIAALEKDMSLSIMDYERMKIFEKQYECDWWHIDLTQVEALYERSFTGFRGYDEPRFRIVRAFILKAHKAEKGYLLYLHY